MSDDELGAEQPERGEQGADQGINATGGSPRPPVRRPRPGPSYRNNYRARQEKSGLNPLIVPLFAAVALLALVLAVVFDRARTSSTPAVAPTATVAPLPTAAPTATLVPVKVPPTTKAGVAAVVNGEIVPMDLYSTLIKVESTRMQRGGTDSSGNPVPGIDFSTATGLKQFHTQEQADLDQLMQTAAAVAYAKKHNLVATSKQVQTQLNAIYAQAGGKAQFLKGVIGEGYTEAVVNKIVTDNATEQNVFAVIGNKAPYDGRNVRQILLATKDKALAAKLAKELQANKGSTFAALAKKYSTDTTSNTAGGSLGVVVKGQMPAAVDKAIFSLKIGQISDPVLASDGYHIIEVTSLGQSQTAKSNYFTTWLTNQAKGAKIYVQIPKS